jgi:hypothetical protein
MLFKFNGDLWRVRLWSPAKCLKNLINEWFIIVYEVRKVNKTVSYAIFMTSCILIVTRYLLLPCGGRTRRPLHCHHFCVPIWFLIASDSSTRALCLVGLSCICGATFTFIGREMSNSYMKILEHFFEVWYIYGIAFCLRADCETVVGLWRGECAMSPCSCLKLKLKHKHCFAVPNMECSVSQS